MKTIDWLNRLYQVVLADLILEEVEVHHNLVVAYRNFRLHDHPIVQGAVVPPFLVAVEEAYSTHDHRDPRHDDHLNVFHSFLEEVEERDLPKNCRRIHQEVGVEPTLDLPLKAWVVLVVPQTSLILLQKYCSAKLACLL